MHLSQRRPSFSSYDIFILTITGFSLFALLVLALPIFDKPAKQIAFTLDTFLSFLFLLDFFFILINTPDKRAYLKWGWIDFFGSLPYLPIFRVLRIFRAIRSIRFLRGNRLQDIWQIIRRKPERTTFWFVASFAIILVALSSYTVLQVEQNSAEQNIETAGDALWWSIVTITTVGYGDHVPQTPGGRFMAAILMFVGIGIFSTLTSYLSTAFIRYRENKDEPENEPSLEEVNARLGTIEEQLSELKSLLAETTNQENS